MKTPEGACGVWGADEVGAGALIFLTVSSITLFEAAFDGMETTLDDRGFSVGAAAAADSPSAATSCSLLILLRPLIFRSLAIFRSSVSEYPDFAFSERSFFAMFCYPLLLCS